MNNLPPDDFTITVRKLQPLIGYKGDPQGRRLARELRRRHPDLVRLRQPGNVAETSVGALRRHAPDLLPKATGDDRAEALKLLRIIHDRIADECDTAVGNSFDRRVAPSLSRFAAELAELKALVEGK
jgi:hypothetical protein